MAEEVYSYRPPISPSEFVLSDPEEEERLPNDLNDEDASSIDLNSFDSEYDSEDSNDEREVIFEEKAIEFSVEESSEDEEELDEVQLYIDKFVKSFQYSDQEIIQFSKGKTRNQIQSDLKHYEDYLIKLKDTVNGKFNGLDTTLQQIINHQLALQLMDTHVVKKKKRVDATLNKNTRPDRKRKSVQIEDDDDTNFIDDEDVEEIQDKEPQVRVMKTVKLTEEERKLADQIEHCIKEKDNLKFREYLRMYARREIPIVVALETKLAYFFRNQQYERACKQLEVLEARKMKQEKDKQAEGEQTIIEDVKESVNFVKEKHGKYLLEYQDYIMEHQIDCIRTAITRMMDGKSLLIAHSMGLGKTLTVLLILKNYNRIFSENRIGKSLKYLVLVPKSNIDHFSKQYAYHFPSGGFLSEIIVVNDNVNIYEKMLEFDRGGRMLVMTYDRCMRMMQDEEKDSEANYAIYLKKADILVIDEAHVIKNPETERFKQFKKFSNSLKLLVTGTPLQNSISEIFTLIRFLEPDNVHVKRLELGFKGIFTDYFNANRTKIENRETLARIQVFYNYFQDLIHRKVNIKEMEEIAEKKEDVIIEFKMSPQEQDIYNFVSQKYQTKCYFARYFYQRLCLDCIEYLQSSDSDERDLQEFSQEYNEEDQATESFLSTLKNYISEKYAQKLASTRLKILKSLVSKIVRGSTSKDQKPEKVVIFSGLVCYNSIIKEELCLDDVVRVGLFTGEMSSVKRSETISQFNNGTINTLLISKNAGGVGIDLTTATNVILFNLDFNFAKDDQAICRLVRKNQKQRVKIFRFVCRDSVDMAVKNLQAHKYVVFDKLLDDISAVIKIAGKGSIPKDLCKIVFREDIPPVTIRKSIVNIERFKLTEDSKEVTEKEVSRANDNIERELSKFQ